MTKSSGGYTHFSGNQSLQTFKVTLEAGSQVSEFIELGVLRLVGLFIPSVFEGKLLAFQVSFLNTAADAVNVHLPEGDGTTILTIPVIVDTFYTLSLLDLNFFPFMRLFADEVQTVTHDITLVTRS